MQINTSKTKEMIFGSLSTANLPLLSTSAGLVERVSTFKLLPAALRAAQICRYLVYSEAHFEVFRPAGATRCTDGGEIWPGGGDRRSPPPCQISPPSVQRVAPAGRKTSKWASDSE